MLVTSYGRVDRMHGGGCSQKKDVLLRQAPSLPSRPRDPTPTDHYALVAAGPRSYVVQQTGRLTNQTTNRRRRRRGARRPNLVDRGNTFFLPPAPALRTKKNESHKPTNEQTTSRGDATSWIGGGGDTPGRDCGRWRGRRTWRRGRGERRTCPPTATAWTMQKKV